MRRRSAMGCLITGGAGFIGSHLVEHLVGAGHDVVVLDDLSTGRRENFAAVRRRISFMRGSVADLSTCRRAMEGVDYVLHHAVVPRFIAAALAGEPPTIYGDGSQTRDFVYVANVVHANLLATRSAAARVAGQVFNVGCGRSMSVNELWDRVRALTGVPVLPRHEAARAGEVKNSLASITKARELVGYQPEVDLDEGLRRTITFYREARMQRRRRRGRAIVQAA